jgi:hypothetical protein
MLEAETSLRTLNAFTDVLVGRLALARAAGTCREFVEVSEVELLGIATRCGGLTDEIALMLDRMAPEIAAGAAAIADIECQRELDRPRSVVASRLHVVDADRLRAR